MIWAHPLALAAMPVALLAAWWLFGRRHGVDDSFVNIKRVWAGRHGLAMLASSLRRESSTLSLPEPRHRPATTVGSGPERLKVNLSTSSCTVM